MVNINQNLGYPGCIFINLKFGVNLTISFLQCGGAAHYLKEAITMYWSRYFIAAS